MSKERGADGRMTRGAYLALQTMAQRAAYLRTFYPEGATMRVRAQVASIRSDRMTIRALAFVQPDGREAPFALYSDAAGDMIWAVRGDAGAPQDFSAACAQRGIGQGSSITCTLVLPAHLSGRDVSFDMRTVQPAGVAATEARDVPSFEAAVRYAQGFLHYHYGLDYDMDVLRLYALALQTDQLVLLVGRSGTGKSSLARHFPEAFGFPRAAVIPVQAGWNDRADLLGCYNPIDQTYVATPFLDALLAAVRLATEPVNRERLFCLCLDEMNLAHVEYYFAEFLSVLQDGAPRIRLYSDSIVADVRSELADNPFVPEDAGGGLTAERMRTLGAAERQYAESLRRKARMLAQYPPSFSIPRNVRFIGTLNQDETTLDLSPKVLDRAFVVRLDAAAAPVEEAAGERYEAAARWRAAGAYPEAAADDRKTGARRLAAVRAALYAPSGTAQGGAALPTLSSRVWRATFGSPAFPAWQRGLGTARAVDALLALAFLPKLRLDGRAYREQKEAIARLCGTDTVSARNLAAIDDSTSIDYWRS